MNNQEPKPNYGGHFRSMLLYGVVVLGSLYILSVFGRAPTKISGFDFFILILAAFRLTRLFVYDLVADFIRDYFKRSPRGRTMSELLYCPWCTGIWMALIVGFLYFLTPLAWYPIFLVALAGAGTFIQFVVNLVMRWTQSIKISET